MDEETLQAARSMLAGGRTKEALSLCRWMLSIAPDRPEIMRLLALALMADGARDEAEDILSRVVALCPEDGPSWLRLGRLVERRAGWAKAAPMFEQAVAGCPEEAAAHANLGQALLARGDFARGWAEYEWRLDALPERLLGLSSPVWDGSDPSGRTILVMAEQGLGDTIQFCRYAPMLAGQGASVVLSVQDELVRLLASSFPSVRVVSWEDEPPPHDARIRLLSLPHRFGTRIDSVPAQTPYLRAEASVKFTSFAAGLVWSGNPANAADSRRSLPFERLAPLWRATDVTFVGLQPGRPPQVPGQPILWPMAGVRDFADTAAIVAGLDLVIGVDTAIIHLAGALGRPVRLLNRLDSCWRWLEGQDDSPWYPNLRQFRQHRSGDWGPVVEAAATDLARMITAAI